MPARNIESIVAPVLAGSGGAPGIEERLAYLERMRSNGTSSREIDRVLIEKCGGLRDGLAQAKEQIEKLARTNEKLTTPGERVGLIVNKGGDADRWVAVRAAGAHFLLPVDEGVDYSALRVGDEVRLNGTENVVVGRVPFPVRLGGDVGAFIQWVTADRKQMLLEWNHAQFLLACGDELRQTDLKRGDLVWIDREAGIAREQISSPEHMNLLLEDVPDVSFDQIGGMEAVISKMKRALVRVIHAERAKRFQVRGQKMQTGVILSSHPGCGKTFVTQAFFNHVKETCGANAKFIYIRPGQFRLSLYGASEAAIRTCFDMVRSLSAEDPSAVIVIYFDEIDSFGAARETGPMKRIDSHVSQSLMAELDGFLSKEQTKLLVVASTNREAALDPAFLRSGRLGDRVLRIPRPDMKAGREIFSKYLTDELAYEGIGRWDLIDIAVSSIYCPNADNDLCEVVMRDGSRRTVMTAELMSGAAIGKMCRFACDEVLFREVETGIESGVREEDVRLAITEEKDALAGMLTVWNIRSFVELPDDIDVTKVERLRRSQVNRHRFKRIGEAA